MDLKKIKKEINGTTVEIIGQIVGQTLWLKQNGQTYTVDLEEKAKSAGKKSRASDGVIKAPMPGKILKIYKQNESEVIEGDQVIAMEAMKMEYVLKAPTSGRITGLTLTSGQQVELGQKLFEVKNENSNR